MTQSIFVSVVQAAIILTGILLVVIVVSLRINARRRMSQRMRKYARFVAPDTLTDE